MQFKRYPMLLIVIVILELINLWGPKTSQKLFQNKWFNTIPIIFNFYYIIRLTFSRLFRARIHIDVDL